jgi:hypothetical protein
MARPQLVGATAAAMLPAALAAAALISAPFAGTTTAPLADASRAPAQSTQAQGTPAQSTQQHTGPTADRPTANLKFDLSVSKGSIATMAGSEALLVGLGAGVIVWARRRRFAED